MASKLQQVSAKACELTKFVAKNGSTYYKQALEQNKQYIVEPPTVEKCTELSKQLFFTRLARFFFASKLLNVCVLLADIGLTCKLENNIIALIQTCISKHYINLFDVCFIHSFSCQPLHLLNSCFFLVFYT